MKILRFLGFCSALCAFVFSVSLAYAGSTSTIGDAPECTDGVCQICDGDKCTNICESGYWGLGGNNNVCTPCTTSPGQAYPNSLYSATYLFNRSIGSCYKYCGANTCINISNSSNQNWTDYGLSDVNIAPFDLSEGNQNIGFYEFASNPGADACDTGTDYCPIIMTCGSIKDACKPRTVAVTFMNGNTTVGTLYVVRDRLWSSRDTNFQINSGNTASYSGVVFPIFQAPSAPQKTGYDFTGYYTAQEGGTQIIGANGQLTQSNALLASAAGTLYAQYQEKSTPCNTAIYLDGNGGTISTNCSQPFYPQLIGGNYKTPSISDKCIPVNSDQNCEFTGFYLKNAQYYDGHMDIQIPIWDLCSQTSVTLTAGWNCPTSTTVKYTCGDGEGNGKTDSATVGQSYTVLNIGDTDCRYDGHEFLHWKLSSTGVTFAGGNTIQNWTYTDTQTFVAQWDGQCNKITFDDNNAAHTNVNGTNPQRKRTGKTSWHDVNPSNPNTCGKEYTSTGPHVEIPTNGNAIFKGYFAPNDSTNAIFGTDGYPTVYGNNWTISTSTTLKALWACPTGYDWDDTTKTCVQGYIVQCPLATNPQQMYIMDGHASQTIIFAPSEEDMLKKCYSTCGANQTLTGWDVYLNNSSQPTPPTLTTYPITITLGVTYGTANTITLRPHCEDNKHTVKYLCYVNGSETTDSSVTHTNYNVWTFANYLQNSNPQCNLAQNNFYEWFFSGDNRLYAGGDVISSWNYGENERFVPGYLAEFKCDTEHWTEPATGTPATQFATLGGSITMPAMNCVPREEFADWINPNANWVYTHTSALTSPVPGATCNAGTFEVSGATTFNWKCPTNLLFTPDDELIEKTIDLSCGSGGNTGQITVTYENHNNLSQMVENWFNEHCNGGPCTNPSGPAHGYWQVCGTWESGAVPNATPIEGLTGCYKLASHDLGQIDWPNVQEFHLSAVSHCPKYVKYRCDADAQDVYENSYAYFEEEYTVLDYATVGCNANGREFSNWQKSDDASVNYAENEVVASWPYETEITLVGQWDSVCYRVDFNDTANGGVNVGNEPLYKIGGQEGWYTDANCSNSVNTPTVDTPTKEHAEFTGYYHVTTESQEIFNSLGALTENGADWTIENATTLYAQYECVLPYHQDPNGTACVACPDDQFWNGVSCQTCPSTFPHSKHPFTWSEKTCYRECPSNTLLGATGQTCNTNPELYGFVCDETAQFEQFSGSTGKQLEFKGNYDANINTCNNAENIYCPRGMFMCGGMAEAFKPMTAPVNFYDGNEQQMYGTRYIFGSRGGSDTIDLNTGKLWSLLAGPGQKTDVLHNTVNGQMTDYQYTYIVYPTYLAPTPDEIAGMSFNGYYAPRTNGTQYIEDTLALSNINAQSVLNVAGGDSNTARKLYAKYSNVQYSLTYDCGNGGTGTPPQSVIGILYGDTITTAQNTCSNPGHEFGGWVVSNSSDIKQPGDAFTWQYTENKVFTASWGDSVIYHINYELYGGTASGTGMPTTYTYESGATINGIPTRDHSIFAGWCTDATLQNCAMLQNIVHETGDKTFYAKWLCESGYTETDNLCNANTITLIYDENGHGVAPTEPASCEYGAIVTLPAAIIPTPDDGYTFNKWTVNGGNFNAGVQIACDYINLGIYQGTATITATWNTNGIVIDWNENGGDELLNGTCIYDGDLTLASAPYYNGYTFNGWLLADGTTYANAASVMQSACTSTYIGVTSGTSTQITAQWCKNCTQPLHGTCTLVPKMNGQCEYTATCDDGYELSGNGTANPTCTNGAYKITYRPNGGNETENQIQPVNYLDSFTTLGGTTFTKANNIMTGWHKVSGGNFTGLATEYSYNVTTDTILDAVWGTCVCNVGTGVESCTTYSVSNTCQGTAVCDGGYINPSVVCNGTTCESACSRCAGGQISVDGDCEPCPAGTYQFGNECKPCPQGSISASGAMICEPCESGYSSNANNTACDANTITIVYANGGHGIAPDQTTCTYGQEFILADAMTDDGYTFENWTTSNKPFDANATIICNYTNLGVYNGTATITGVWDTGKYTVSFDANGGTGGQTADVIATYNHQMPHISSVAPTYIGHTFMGWYDNENYLAGTQYYTPNGQSARVYDKTNDTTLYAGWAINTITLNYSNAGHGNTPNSNTCQYGASVVLPAAIIAEGFTFKNWVVANNTFDAGETIICNMENLGIDKGTVTVVAQWDSNQYTVTYNCGIASGDAPVSQTASYNQNFTPAISTCYYDGHTFAGWLVSGTNDIRDESVPFKWLYAENKTLTAQWNAQGYNIYYEMNGGTNYANAPQTYVYGIGATINGVPTRSNSTFKGWCIGNTTNCAMSQTISRTDIGDKTLVAKWACTSGHVPNDDNTACDACTTGQHAENGQCVDDVIECTLPDAIYSTRTWNQSLGAYGPCTVIDCATDYHIVANTCVKDVRQCQLQNGYGTQEWNGAQWGKCIPTVCDSGFEVVGDYCEECSNRRLNGEIVVSSYANECEIATCMYHGQKYTLDNNECIPICETKSDETGSMVWNESRKKCVRTCNAGYKMW